MRYVTIKNNNLMMQLYEGQAINGNIVKDIEVNTGANQIEVRATDITNNVIKKVLMPITATIIIDYFN